MQKTAELGHNSWSQCGKQTVPEPHLACEEGSDTEAPELGRSSW